MYYSHSFEDPENGEIIDVMVDDDPELRNAGSRDHRSGGHRHPGSSRMPWRIPGPPGGFPSRPRPRHQGDGAQGSGAPGRVIVRSPSPRPTRPVPGHPGYPGHPGHPGHPGYPGPVDTGEHLVIRKTAIAEAITFIGPAVGQVMASFLGLPEPPSIVGNDITDRENAAMHRDALARHQQSQTRILALTDLASRAARLLFT